MNTFFEKRITEAQEELERKQYEAKVMERFIKKHSLEVLMDVADSVEVSSNVYWRGNGDSRELYDYGGGSMKFYLNSESQEYKIGKLMLTTNLNFRKEGYGIVWVCGGFGKRLGIEWVYRDDATDEHVRIVAHEPLPEVGTDINGTCRVEKVTNTSTTTQLVCSKS